MSLFSLGLDDPAREERTGGGGGMGHRGTERGLKEMFLA